MEDPLLCYVYSEASLKRIILSIINTLTLLFCIYVHMYCIVYYYAFVLWNEPLHYVLCIQLHMYVYVCYYTYIMYIYIGYVCTHMHYVDAYSR